MWRSEKQTANSKRHTAGSQRRGLSAARRRTCACLLLSAFCLLFFAACRRDMQDQPKMKPFRSSSFFKDGQSSRQLVEGTVPRGFLQTDTEYFTGKKAARASTLSAGRSQASQAGQAGSGQDGARPAGPQPSAQQPSRPGTTTGPALQGAAAFPDDVEVFPIPITQEIVVRGKERYEIFCSACHGLTGKGDGMIVRRGFRRAASFHDPKLREAPVGHFFDAITNGWGAMPSYAPQIPVEDRWAIIAYIRALQISQELQAPGAAPPSATPASSPAYNGGQHR